MEFRSVLSNQCSLVEIVIDLNRFRQLELQRAIPNPSAIWAYLRWYKNRNNLGVQALVRPALKRLSRR